jgi:hypothetical protein
MSGVKCISSFSVLLNPVIAALVENKILCYGITVIQASKYCGERWMGNSDWGIVNGEWGAGKGHWWPLTTYSFFLDVNELFRVKFDSNGIFRTCWRSAI